MVNQVLEITWYGWTLGEMAMIVLSGICLSAFLEMVGFWAWLRRKLEI